MSKFEKNILYLDEFHNIEGMDSETYRKMGTSSKNNKERVWGFVKRLLTTGQMLDQLEFGRIAERIFEPIGVCSDAYTKVKVDEDGDLLFYVEHNESWSYERLTGSVINSKWIIK